jgi:23S rRNA pseudouridine2604 synthase
LKVDKYIGHSGFCSRRKASVLIDERRVTVNDKIATHSTKIIEGDVVKINGLVIPSSCPEYFYIAYNKPRGIECTTEEKTDNIISAINFPTEILPIGRLDKNSEGLILLTNHKKLIDRIINPKFQHEKEYIVTLNHPVTNEFLEKIQNGVIVNDELTKPCKAFTVPNNKKVFRIILTQGLNRQIRRMCNLFDYQVLKLQRVRVMHIRLDNLKTGQWRLLTEKELSELFSQCQV